MTGGGAASPSSGSEAGSATTSFALIAPSGSRTWRCSSTRWGAVQASGPRSADASRGARGRVPNLRRVVLLGEQRALPPMPGLRRVAVKSPQFGSLRC